MTPYIKSSRRIARLLATARRGVPGPFQSSSAPLPQHELNWNRDMNPPRPGLKLLAATLIAVTTLSAHAAVDLIAIGSMSGTYEDLSSRTAAPWRTGSLATAWGASAQAWHTQGATSSLLYRTGDPMPCPMTPTSTTRHPISSASRP